MHGMWLIAHHWPWFWPVVIAVLGAVFGSFANCALHRVPRGMSLRLPPSHCPSCQTVLGVPDLVPIFSWLALRGKCRHCKAAIPARSLWVEVAFAAYAQAAYAATGPTLWLWPVLTVWLAVGLLVLFAAQRKGFLAS